MLNFRFHRKSLLLELRNFRPQCFEYFHCLILIKVHILRRVKYIVRQILFRGQRSNIPEHRAPHNLEILFRGRVFQLIPIKLRQQNPARETAFVCFENPLLLNFRKNKYRVHNLFLLKKLKSFQIRQNLNHF